MKGRAAVLIMFGAISVMCFAAADGSWLRRVPAAERGRVNPYAEKPDAVAAGANLFSENCAKCHGEDAEGKGKRPPLRSERIKNATDGELAWLLKNGNQFKGMPIWGGLPEPERWQIIVYVRSLNTPSPAVQR